MELKKPGWTGTTTQKTPKKVREMKKTNLKSFQKADECFRSTVIYE